MKQTPYWWEEAPLHSLSNLQLPEKADVLIVGSGYTGLCASLVLARAGVDVVVVDAGLPGYGASSRNGGMVGPSFHKLGIAGLRAQYGEEKTDEILRESVGFVDFIEKFLREENIEADFKRVGRFRGALHPKHYDSMSAELERLQEACGVKGHMVSKSAQSEETGATCFHGGVVYEMDGGLHPAKYHNGLLQRVLEAGVKVVANCAVKNFEKKDGKYKVATGLGDIVTDKVAICTNGYTGAPFDDLKKRILPLRSAIIATEELSDNLISNLMPKRRMYGDSRRIVAYYRPSPDGKRILFGGRASGLTDKPDANARILRNSMIEIYPELADVKLDFIWSGKVAYTFDHSPHIGTINGLYYAMGYCGSGVARSSYFGTRLGYKILGDVENGRTSFDELQMQGKPFYSGNPWFMPAVLNWHRVADRLGL